MKKTSKLISAFILTIILILSASLFGCSAKKNPEACFIFKNGDSVQKISIDITDYENKTVYDIIKSQKYSDVLKADITEGESPYLNAIYGIVPDTAKQQYISLLTTLSDYKYGEESVTVDEVVFYYASKGIYELPVISGASYMFALESWGNYEADLASAKTTAVSDLKGYVKAEDYREEQKTELASVISGAEIKINGAEYISDVNSALSAAKTEIDKIKTDAEFTAEEPTIKTKITDGKTYKSKNYTFDVWSKDKDGTKLATECYFNGIKTEYKWDDSTKTSFTVQFAQYENTIVLKTADSTGNKKEVNYTVYYTEGDIEVTISIEAFTIGNGYVVEPANITVDQNLLAEMKTDKDSFNGAMLLDYVVKQNGMTYSKTGNITSGFYLSAIGFTNYNNISAEMKTKLETNGFSISEDASNELGEFCYTNGSGWMYCVNGIFPNVGMSDYYPQDGDVMRVQFTLAYGADIGGASAMGWGYAEDYFPSVDRDALTALMGRINKLELAKNGIYSETLKVISKDNVNQTELDAAYKDLYNSYSSRLI